MRHILQPLEGERGGGGTDGVYLSAFNNRLGHKDFDLHVGVILRPAVVFSHRAVVAVGLGLKVLLSSETQRAHAKSLKKQQYVNHLDTCR